MEQELKNKVIEHATKELVEKVGGSYSARSALEAEIATKAAEIIWEKEQLNILKRIDLDTVVRLATLQLIKRVTSNV